MASLQDIVDKSTSLQINRRNVVGLQFTRNEIPRASVTPTKNPWQFTFQMPSSYRYNEARALLEVVDRLDRYQPQTITFSNNLNFSWMFRYQGSMNQAMINAIQVDDYTGNILTLKNLPAIAASRVLFEPNDLIQIGAIDAYPFPFTSQFQVLRGTGSTVQVQTSRPNILTGNLVNQPIRVGNVCQFRMFVPNMPVYRLTVGGYQKSNGVLLNNALIEWSDSFNFYEYVGAA